MSCKVFKNTSSLLTVTDAHENPAKLYKLVFFRYPSTETLNTFFCEVLTNSHCSVHHHGANKANRRVRVFLKRRSARETADADQSLGETSEDQRKMRHLVLCTVPSASPPLTGLHCSLRMADRSLSFTATKVCSSDMRAALRSFRSSRKGMCAQLPASCQVFDGQHLFDIKLAVRGFPAEHMGELHDVGPRESAARGESTLSAQAS